MFKEYRIITDELPFCEEFPKIKLKNGAVIICSSTRKEKLRGYSENV